jgi:hypothetical protein
MPKIYGNTEILGGDLTVLGNMVISGTQTSLNVEELKVADNIITLNATFSGAPVLDSGIEINRGSGTNSRLIWDETTDYWVAGLSGSETPLLTGSGTTNYIPRWTGVDTLSSTSSIYDDGTKVGIGTNTPDSNSIFSIKGSNTNTTNYGINIKVEGAAQNNNGAYILLSNSTSQSTGIFMSWGGGTTGKKVGIDVGGGLSVGSSDVGYQYNSTSTTQNSNYGSYLRISSTQSSNTGNYNTITNGLSNGTHQNIYTVMSGGDYSTTYGFRSTNTSTSTTKYGTNINISGNGLSSQNYGTYVNISGANSTNFGTYTNISGTYSNTNYGNYTNMSLGKNTTYGSYIRISGDDTGRYVGNYVNITANSGTNSQQNYGSQIQNFGNGSFNTGLLVQSHNGTLGNFGIWTVIGTTTPFTVGDIGIYSYIGANAKLTTYPSLGGYFSNNSSSTSVNHGVSIECNGTYSSSNVGLDISTAGSTGDNIAIRTRNGDTVFNENGGDWDFRIEGLTQSNLFFVDADQDRVGIATNTPGADFEVNGFTKLGSDAPAIKTKMIEITTPASGISGAASSHFITGTIISYDIVIEAVDNKFVKPYNTQGFSNSDYDAHVTTTSISYSGDYTTNTNIANSPLRCYITYIE